MAVIVGSARIDERGNATGGQAGDQTGNEVSTQKWYKHQKGWRVLRCRDPARAVKIASAMRSACDNPFIGYDQNQRLTLYNEAAKYGFDPGRVRVPVETDCSALVRVCLAYAGIMCANFRTTNQAQIMLSTGMFDELTGAKYTDSSDYLRTGDVLVTRTQGHTVVVLTSGPKAGDAEVPDESALGKRILRVGCAGVDVMELQTMLISIGYDCGSWGADGDFGDCTEIAVRRFQQDHGCGVDGEVGPETLAALRKAVNAKEPSDPHYVEIVGGNCYVRTLPGTHGAQRGVAHEGAKLPYLGETSGNGWLKVEYKSEPGWVSGKYGRLVVS